MSPTDLAVQEQQSAKTSHQVVNDFSIQVATVNGSGSQTANLVLLRSILSMGVPVSGKNMFPSNIAGLPTWYTIRASKRGYIARKKEVDFLVAMNPETAKEDVLTLDPGAAVVYDEPLKLSCLRRRPGVLPGAVRQARGAGVPRRQAPAPRAQHDLRRRARQAAGHRPGADGEGARQADGEEGEGRGVERRRAQGGLGLRRGSPHQAGPLRPRAHERDGGEDSHRGQRRGRHRLHDGRRHRRRVVPDHAVLVAVRVAHRLHEEIPDRQDDREGDVRHRAGGRRDCVARDGDWRELGGRAVDDGDGRSRDFADGRVRRPGVLCRDSGRHLRRAARRAFHRPADAHRPGRPDSGRLSLARRHQARHAHARLGGGVLHDGAGGLRARRAVPDADFRDDGPRSRHEQLDVRGLQVSRPADQPGQGADRPRR